MLKESLGWENPPDALHEELTKLDGPNTVFVARDKGGDLFWYDHPPRFDAVVGQWWPSEGEMRSLPSDLFPAVGPGSVGVVTLTIPAEPEVAK